MVEVAAIFTSEMQMWPGQGSTWSAFRLVYRVATGYAALLTRCCYIHSVSMLFPSHGSWNQVFNSQWEGDFKEKTLELSIVNSCTVGRGQMSCEKP